MCSHTSRNITLIVEEMYDIKLSETQVESLFCCCFLFLFDVLVAVVVMASLTPACQQALRASLAAGREKEERPGELECRLLKPCMET